MDWKQSRGRRTMRPRAPAAVSLRARPAIAVRRARAITEGTTMAEQKIQLHLRSDNITQGKARAPNRSMYYGMGYKETDFGKPMVGIANGHSTITPCNSGLQKLADAAV